MDFNLRPASRQCSATGRDFQPGEVCWSALIQEDGRLVRHDYCQEAWQGPPEDAVGHWQYIVPSTTAQSLKITDTNSLFDYFVQLCESPNHVEQDYQYVLALLLLRKRRLILEESIEVDDQPAMRLMGSGGEGPFDVVERELSDDQIQILQSQLYGQSNAA